MPTWDANPIITPPRLSPRRDAMQVRWFMRQDPVAHAKITQITAKDDGTVVFAYQGDESVEGIYYTVDASAVANEPDDPDSADDYVAGQKGTVTTATTASPGDTAWVKVAGKNSLDVIVTGDDIDEAQFIVPAQAVAFLSATLAVNDDGSDDVYTASWTTNSSVNDTDHRISVAYYREDVYVGASTGTTPSDGSKVFTDTGAGDGAADLHNMVIQIVDQGTGSPLASVTTRPFLSTT